MFFRKKLIHANVLAEVFKKAASLSCALILQFLMNLSLLQTELRILRVQSHVRGLFTFGHSYCLKKPMKIANLMDLLRVVLFFNYMRRKERKLEARDWRKLYALKSSKFQSVDYPPFLSKSNFHQNTSTIFFLRRISRVKKLRLQGFTCNINFNFYNMMHVSHFQ